MSNSPGVRPSLDDLPSRAGASDLVRILLVEDNKFDFVLLREILNKVEGLQYSLDWVMTVPDAIAALRRKAHDIALVDFQLIGGSGLDVLRSAQAIDWPSPVLMMTGYDDPSFDDQAMKLGAYGFLCKGEQKPRQLERSMRYAIEKKRMENTTRATNQALRLAKQSAAQANAMKSQFLANMSHELRTPLNSIIGFSEMIMNGTLGPMKPVKYKEYIDNIHRGGKRLLSLIDDLLDLSRAENDTLTIFEEKLDPVALAHSVVDTLRPQASDKKIDVTVSASASPGRLLGDEQMVQQVLLNLISNAVKFTSEGGTVSVEIGRTGQGELSLVVRDTGIGMTQEQINRAFVAFVHVENAYRRSGSEGAGIGLAVSRRFVELHQGTIRLESEKDRGTTATVAFPAARVVAIDGPEGDPVPPGGSGAD